MNKLQQMIYNEGERLVPYVSHDEDELVRHRSSYAFFHKVIAADLATLPQEREDISIADLGFGSGYGCALLSSLPKSQITGVDIGPECKIFAEQYYSRSNVNYLIEDLTRFVPEMEPFDYAVSRGVLEHVPNGLNLIKLIKFRRRVMIDVPFDESPGNPHHILIGIKEDTFAGLPNCEIFYEDLNGQIFDAAHKPEKPNMVMIVMSAPDLRNVSDFIEFPLLPVRDNLLEAASGVNRVGRHYYFETPEDLLMSVEKAVKETETVLDIGCGIAPMNYFRPKLHMMVDPWKEYTEILSYRYSGDKSVLVLRGEALEALRQFADNSVDSIFLLDVIEHMDKAIGRQVIEESERVANEQIVIFSPLGFMPQHMESHESDGWGLSGTLYQEHRSGWTPEDFSSEWSCYVCEGFHSNDFKGDKLDQRVGAFFAIRNFEGKTICVPERISDYRRPLPSELKVCELQEQLQTQQNELKQQCDRLEALRSEHNILLNSRGMRIVRLARRILSVVGLMR